MRYATDTVYDERFNAIIGNEKYIFKTTLFNPDGNVMSLAKGAILELNLIDNIFEPWLRGSVTIRNEQDALERFVTMPTETEFNDDKAKEKGYTVRGDGRDLLEITIIPLNVIKQDYDSQNDDFNKTYGLKYTFTLEDEESVEISEIQAKKYSIIDYDLEILKERKSFFSSANLLDEKTGIDTQLSNNDRSVETGKCIKEILAKALTDEHVVEKIEDEDGNETTPFFEDGLSKIFYSSPSQYSAYDDINYLVSKHVSNHTKTDFSVLKKENFSGQYTLQSIASFFEKSYNNVTSKSGSRFIENFTITGGGSSSGEIIEKEQKKPANAIEFGEASEIINYKFFNTSSRIRRDKVASHIVHSYDYNKKEFNIDTADANIVNAKDTFSDNYVTMLKGKNNSPSPNFIVNGMQRDNLNFINVYSEYGDSSIIRKSYGINKLLKNALITNMGVEIVVKGQLQRKSGRFFSLDRADDYIENTFDNKLLGIYFILDVEHFFDKNNYYNRIIATKTYHFDDPRFFEERI